MTYVLFAAEYNNRDYPAYGPFVHNGLMQGLISGEGNADFLFTHNRPIFYVADVADVDIYQTSVDGQCDFFRGNVLARGTYPHIIYWLKTHGGLPWIEHPPFGLSSVSFGVNGHAHAGHYGTAVGASSYKQIVTSGDYGVSMSYANDSIATSGYRGVSITGRNGRSKSGKYGVSITGINGVANAGYMGILVIHYEAFGQEDKAVGIVDDGQILSDRWYKLDDMGNFKEMIG